ncbi:unnamed protein product [Cochlearia groenlandica]
MSGFLERLRVRPDRRKVYDLDDSDDDVNPLAELERILDYEMRCTLTNQTDSDNVAPEQVFVKQYLVKWKGLSYLHCSWVPEQEFEKAYKFNPRLRTSMNKFHSRMDGIRNNGDDFVAIRPEWTTVDRIIASRGEEDGKKYLVKFKELSYDECCWESESDISTFQNEIQRFKDINSGSRRDKYVENEINRKEFKQLDHTPDFLKGSLHPYQLEGLNFLRFSWSKRTHVILADEMGLGKTIQSIAFLASLFEENLAPHLVVVPLSTLRNWEKEFGTWAPHMNVVVYGGNSKARTVIREHEFYFKKMKSGQISGEKKQDRIKFDVLLTSYEMINIDIAVLKSIKWKCLIVDEGHRLKNKDSRLFSSLKQYKSKHRVLLTGTPLQVYKYEVHQSEKLNSLGKRKRNRKQMFEEYDLAGLEVSSDDETEPTNEQEPGQGNQTGKRPYRRKNRERSLSVLGFEKNERKVFLQTIMRYGVGNYDWKDFIKPLEQKTYEEIKDYGVLFLKHLIEDTEDSAPDYSDGVPKEGLKRDEVLARISLLMLVKEKSKFVEDHPTKPIFPNRILQRFPGLQSGNPWKEEHDKILLHGVSKHGFGKWVTILEDKKLGIKKLICEELNFPYTVMSAAEQASLPESSLNQKSDTPGNNNASANAGKKKTMIPYRDIMRKLGDFVRRRFSVLELALKYECAEEYYNLSPMESISENISRSLSVVGTEHDDVEMKDSEEKAEEDVDVKLKAAETDHVIVLD